jgi:hypothetical protein
MLPEYETPMPAWSTLMMESDEPSPYSVKSPEMVIAEVVR